MDTTRRSASREHLGRSLDEFGQWRKSIVDAVEEFRAWLEAGQYGEAQDDLRLYELIEELRSDKLLVALVGEFSRGKTALVNAIFFADHRQHFLPTDPGRTTRCPTELLYEPGRSPSLRLLPIETRNSARTVADFKRSPHYWTTLELDVEDGSAMARTLSELTRMKEVTAEQARALGLLEDTNAGEQPSTYPVPAWRHAIINYPHPLLKQGLVVLDTPGLNSLGTEPELTLGMLPAAHVIVYVLAADTGVTRSDMQVWRDHVRTARKDGKRASIVVLNKTDTMWDDPRGQQAVVDGINRQVAETARVLGVPPRQVLPVSAQKGLVGKIRDDPDLLERSCLPALERQIAEDVLPVKRKLLLDHVSAEVGEFIDTALARIRGQLHGVDEEIAQIRGLSGRSQEDIRTMMAQLERSKSTYERKRGIVEPTRKRLAAEVNKLLHRLSMDELDRLIARTRMEMKGSWTTLGLQSGIKNFFGEAAAILDDTQKQTGHIKELVEQTYRDFEIRDELGRIKQSSFDVQRFREQLDALHQEAEEYRRSPAMMMTEQHFVCRKFFITMVSRVREVFVQINKRAERWSRATMAPVFAQIRDLEATLNMQMQNLRTAQRNTGNLRLRLQELERDRQRLDRDANLLHRLRNRVEPRKPPASHERGGASSEATG